MAHGAVIENLSTKKLLIILSACAGLLAVFVLIGAYFTPNPSTSMEFLTTKCSDPTAGRSKEWFYVRPMKCNVIDDLSSHTLLSSDVRDIVFVAQMPHARNGVELEYSRWFQFLLGLLEVDIAYDDAYTVPSSANFELEVRMGYKEHGEDEWNTLSEAVIHRNLECEIDQDKRAKGHLYNCSTIDLFELGANVYPSYLLNIRIPVNQTLCRINPQGPNCKIGLIQDLRVIAIHQNGGFTLIWLWMKTLIWPVVCAATYWYFKRLSGMRRPPTLNENCILALGVSMAILDFPIEWITLYSQAWYLLLLSDIRLGLFYTVLFSFWLVFTGENIVDQKIHTLSSYWRNLTSVIVTSTSLLLYDLFERGLQLKNPFHSIWASEFGSALATLTIYLAGLSALFYFGFLTFKMSKAWRAIQNKRAELYRLKELNRLKVQGVIYRFKFLFLLTLACAGLTILSYVMKHYGEMQLHGDEHEQSWLSRPTSAFFTGTFGMWNIYVLILLAMYAPSHKVYSGTTTLEDEQDDLIDAQVDSTPLTTFLKPSTD
ncbi:unnamed protein product [Bursaphelenchus xylophilus]|uniref:(pine wood nematode) hypothetical protein n=1 Tax=Bursaphelenchus xylophilus TaxID=6326 RepID=A0A1I7RPN6_BURXY|nr:unnamed protein product [Bursaphelenchus xylophilus]CAG9096352.1 unnamed protein product [Bursaphelenchus xylophilus]